MNEYLSSFKVANYTVAEGDEVRFCRSCFQSSLSVVLWYHLHM